MSYSIECSPGVEALNKRLMQKASGTEGEYGNEIVMEENPDEGSSMEGDENIIITKKQKLSYKEALNHKKTYINDHHETTPRHKTRTTDKNGRTKKDNTCPEERIKDIVMKEVQQIVPMMVRGGRRRKLALT